MELHTLGVDGGYTQADVTSLARVITGWTFVGRDGRIGVPGSPVFFANYHEPGAQTVLGRTYQQADRAQGARGSRRSRPQSGDGPPCRDEIRRAISSPTIRRRRSSRGWARHSSKPTAI